MNAFTIATQEMARLIAMSNASDKVLESIVNQVIGDGSPRGTYATLAELINNHPTGAVGIYLVTENGHWYYWDGEWKDGGVYQATEVPNGAISEQKLDVQLKSKVGKIPTLQAEIDTQTTKLTSHETSNNAHNSSSISYSGSVVGAVTTKQAIDNLKQEVNTIVASAGDGTKDTELIVARGNKPTLGDRLSSTDAQLADIEINAKSFGAKGDGVTDDYASLQSAINAAIAQGSVLKINKGTHKLSAGLVVDGPIQLDCNFREVILDFTSMVSGYAFTIGDLKEINGLDISGLYLKGNENITAININNSDSISKPLTDSVLKNFRVEGFKLGLKGSYSWGIIFENIRFQNCVKDMELGSQFNFIEFQKCSFVSTEKFATLNNCEGINFNTCEFANLVGAQYGITAYQSYITITNPYIEYVPKFLQLGSPSESTASTCDIRGGLIDGRINIARNKAILNISGSRANYADFGINAGLDDVGAVFMNKSTISVISNHVTKWLSSWYGNTAIPFADAFGGGLTKIQLRDSMQLQHSFSNQGIKLSSTLEVGKQYLLVMAIQKSSGASVSLTGTISNDISGYVKAYDGQFEVVYLPFIAKTTTLNLTWGSGSIYARYIGLLEGVEFPVVDIKKEIPIYASSAPSAGTWIQPSYVKNLTPSVGQPKGWTLSVAGTPGTWVSEGNL